MYKNTLESRVNRLEKYIAKLIPFKGFKEGRRWIRN